jgi:phage gpG-like protein
MAFRISFELDGVTEFDRILDMTAKTVKDFKPLYEEIADDFRSTEAGIFNKQGAFEGGSKWKALSPDYKAWKARKYPGRKILELTGSLKRSLTSVGGNHVSQPTTDSIRIGTKDPKASYHQKGTSKMPQRKPMFLTDASKKRWVKLAHTFIFRSMTSGERRKFQSGGGGRR